MTDSRIITIFDNSTKQLGIDMYTSQGRKEFGKSATKYVDHYRYNIGGMSKGETFRKYIFFILKICIVLIAVITIVLKAIKPKDEELKKKLEKYSKNSEKIFMIFLGVIVVYFFAPWGERIILTKTDMLIAFVAGVLLITTSFSV